MFAFIRGSLAEVGENYIVLENQGIGYQIYVPTTVLEDIPGVGSEVKIYTYMYIREDQMALYGFLTKDDLNVFKMLIGVSGIGPKGALGILSKISPDALRFAIMAGDSKAIAKAPGIGPKTAQRVIIELKDKLKPEDLLGGELPPDAETVPENGAKKEAMMALVSLGYSETEAFKALQKIQVPAEADSETLLKLALKEMLTF